MMPELFFRLAGPLCNRWTAIAIVAFGMIGAPLILVYFDGLGLYGPALLAAAWWPIALIVWFHPQRRAGYSALEGWFYALILDVLGLTVPFVLLLAAGVF